MFKKPRKIPAILLVILILLTTTVSCAGTQTQKAQTMPQMEFESEVTFTDITGSWAYEAISFVVDRGLFEGTSETTFSPNQAMTRKGFASVLARMAGKDSSEAAEIENGSANLTRENMAVMLHEYIDSIGLLEEDSSAAGTSAGSTKTAAFTDASKISRSAATGVSAVASLGLMSGKSNGSFSPAGTTTRAEAAAVIYRLCKLIDSANTSDTLLAKLSEKTASIEQYSDYQKNDYQTITLKGSSVSFSGAGASVDGNTITISDAGTYVVSGTLKDGRIIVDSEDGDNVRLVLNNAAITSSDGSPVIIKNAKNTIISLPEGTESVLTDGSSNTFDEEVTGALFSSDDLWINGSGALTVNGNFKDGISGNDDIQITQAQIVIKAKDDGIKANDSVSVNNADITITSAGDGIKTTNVSEIGKGYITVKGGSLDITPGAEGIQAETLLYIQDGSFKANSAGTITDENGDSSKGLTAGSGIIIEDGSFNIDSIDDALHSNGLIKVKGGTFSILTGDDALHADSSLIIAGGTFDISKCYEGIESRVIELAGGTIDLTSNDDGINVAGGSSNAMGRGRPGENSTANSSYKLTISGGDIKVNAGGDAIDVNGSAYMTGGKVLVNGPTNDGNGAMDYDGVFEISGGTLLAAGSAGMAMAPSSGSTLYTIANTTGEQTAGTEVKLVDSTGKTVVSFTPEKVFAHVVISSPDIKKGSTYSLYAGSTEIETFTITDVISGDTSINGMPGGHVGGGMRPNGGNGMPPSGGTPPGGGPGGTPPDQL